MKSGKIGIFAELDDYKHKKKLLRTISNSLNSEVANNCYGYTSVISARRVRLQAVASELTSVYYIQKEQFHRCSEENLLDAEYLKEIKDKFELAEMIEKFEVP